MFVLLLPGCKKKEVFEEPGIILKKWSSAIEKMNYQVYKKCEAYPREWAVFNEIYRNQYFEDINIIKIEDLDEKDIKQDYEGHYYLKRNVIFECTEVNRQKREKVKRVRGEVFFIKFIGSEREKEGWLMANRTMIRLPE